jgi:hypothetical protein
MKWAILITRTEDGVSVEYAAKTRLKPEERAEGEMAYQAVCSLPKTTQSARNERRVIR